MSESNYELQQPLEDSDYFESLRANLDPKIFFVDTIYYKEQMKDFNYRNPTYGVTVEFKFLKKIQDCDFLESSQLQFYINLFKKAYPEVKLAAATCHFFADFIVSLQKPTYNDLQSQIINQVTQKEQEKQNKSQYQISEQFLETKIISEKQLSNKCQAESNIANVSNTFTNNDYNSNQQTIQQNNQQNQKQSQSEIHYKNSDQQQIFNNSYKSEIIQNNNEITKPLCQKSQIVNSVEGGSSQQTQQQNTQQNQDNISYQSEIIDKTLFSNIMQNKNETKEDVQVSSNRQSQIHNQFQGPSYQQNTQQTYNQSYSQSEIISKQDINQKNIHNTPQSDIILNKKETIKDELLSSNQQIQTHNQVQEVSNQQTKQQNNQQIQSQEYLQSQIQPAQKQNINVEKSAQSKDDQFTLQQKANQENNDSQTKSSQTHSISSNSMYNEQQYLKNDQGQSKLENQFSVQQNQQNYFPEQKIEIEQKQVQPPPEKKYHFQITNITVEKPANQEQIKKSQLPYLIKQFAEMNNLTEDQLKQQDYWYFPINQFQSHWVSVVINLKKKIIYYFDSYYKKVESMITQGIESILEYFKFNPKQFKITPIYNQQINGYDCGVFILLSLLYTLQQKEYTYNQAIATKFRRKYLYSLAVIGAQQDIDEQCLEFLTGKKIG